MHITGALFDLDGVLIDSEPGYTVFWTQTARRYGLPHPAQYALDIKGTALSRILQSFDPGDRDGIVEALHEFERTRPYPLYPGAEDFLRRLRGMGVRCALVTSSDDTKMGYLWTQHPQLRGNFDAVVTGSMVTHSKPHPEGYLKGAAMLGLQPGSCVVFEDSLQGLAAGRAAGCRVVGLTTGNPASAVAPLCDLVAASLAEIDPESLPS